jgi:hypothetical protein
MPSSRSKKIIGIGVVVAGVLLGQPSPHELQTFGQHDMGQPPHLDDDHGNEPRSDSAELTAPTMTSTPRVTSHFIIEEQAPGVTTFAILARFPISAAGGLRLWGGSPQERSSQVIV